MSNNYSLTVTNNTLRLSMNSFGSVGFEFYAGILTANLPLVVAFLLYDTSGMKRVLAVLLCLFSLLPGYLGFRLLHQAWRTDMAIDLCIEHQISGKSLLTLNWKFMFGRKKQQTILFPADTPLARVRSIVLSRFQNGSAITLLLPDAAEGCDLSHMYNNSHDMSMSHEEVGALVRVLNAFAANGSDGIDPADAALVELQTVA